MTTKNYTIKEAEEILNCGRKKIEKMILDKTIRVFDLNPNGTYRQYRIPEEEIERLKHGN